MELEIEIVLGENATMPKRATEYAAGYDLCVAADGTLAPGEQATLPTNVHMAISRGYYGRLVGRSGLATKGLSVHPGTIDSDYSGGIGIIMRNHSTTPFVYKCGDRLAQIIIEKCQDVVFRVVEKLPETARGSGGFGSTGGFQHSGK